MKKWISLAIGCVLLVVLHSCYLGKNIEKPISVFVDVRGLVTATSVNSQYPQYIYYKTAEQYQQAFYAGLMDETTYQKNITIVAQQPADYTLRVTSFEVSEGESKETVNDDKSPYNGQTYFLASINTTATFEILQGNNKLDSYTARADKSEKLKNNQNLVQIIAGTNKDGTQYREKTMQDDVCEDMSKKCGKRTWNLFTQKLAKKMK